MKDPFFDELFFESSPVGPPERSGVYAVCGQRWVDLYDKKKEQVVFYIGSSKNIQKRVLSSQHIYRRLYNLVSNTWCIYTLTFLCDDFYREIERDMIRKYKPRFNTQQTHG